MNKLSNDEAANLRRLRERHDVQDAIVMVDDLCSSLAAACGHENGSGCVVCLLFQRATQAKIQLESIHEDLDTALTNGPAPK